MTRITIGSASQWSDAIASEIVPLGVLETSTSFTASIDRRDLAADVRITRVSSGANSIARSSRHITSSDDGFAIFHLNIRGAGKVSQHGRDCEIHGLSSTLYTTDLPSRFLFSADYECLLVQLPRELLPISGTELQGFSVRPIVGEPLLRILLSVVDESHHELPHMGCTHRRVLSSTVLDLITSLLVADRAQEDKMPDALLLEMRHCVERNLDDPEFNLSALAKNFHVSTRMVHKIFAQSGETPGHSILAARLSKAKQILRQTSLPIQAIAAQCGFREYSTFTRAFRRDSGMSPSEWRADQRTVSHLHNRLHNSESL